MDDPERRLIDVLRKANERGEIGYAFGGKNEELPYVRECERRGWIAFSHDATPGIGSAYEGQKRNIYLLTTKGRKVSELRS